MCCLVMQLFPYRYHHYSYADVQRWWLNDPDHTSAESDLTAMQKIKVIKHCGCEMT